MFLKVTYVKKTSLLIYFFKKIFFIFSTYRKKNQTYSEEPYQYNNTQAVQTRVNKTGSKVRKAGRTAAVVMF